MSKFPKAWAIGHRNTEKLFKGVVEITEKLDGSQIGFGRVDGKLIVRSKGAVLDLDAPTQMFYEGCEYLKTIVDKLYPGYFYYGEYLKKPKHNTLTYERIPKNHIALFGIKELNGSFVMDWNILHSEANRLGIEVVQLLDYIEVTSADQLKSYLIKTSQLGGPQIEGVVVKNYAHDIVIADQWVPFIQGKHVSEAFKEKNGSGWKKNSGKGKIETMMDFLRSDEARWMKAVAALRDQDLLKNDPSDIGSLLKHINQDFIEEEGEMTAYHLWEIYKKDILRAVTQGFPQWYKDMLMEGAFDETL